VEYVRFHEALLSPENNTVLISCYDSEVVGGRYISSIYQLHVSRMRESILQPSALSVIARYSRI